MPLWHRSPETRAARCTERARMETVLAGCCTVPAANGSCPDGLARARASAGPNESPGRVGKPERPSVVLTTGLGFDRLVWTILVWTSYFLYPNRRVENGSPQSARQAALGGRRILGAAGELRADAFIAGGDCSGQR